LRDTTRSLTPALLPLYTSKGAAKKMTQSQTCDYFITP